MSIRGTLALDHFFIGTTEESFNEIKELFGSFKRFSHSVIQTDDGDGWEGCYLYSRNRVYFEILKDRRVDSLGISMAPFVPYVFDAADVIKENGDLEWKSGKRELEGKLWYEWFSTGNYLQHRANEFVTWIMKYHPRKLSYKLETISQPATVDQFLTAKFICAPKCIAEMKQNAKWYPDHSVIEEGSDLEIHLKQPDGFDFHMTMENRDELKGIHLQKLTFKSLQQISLHPFKLKHWHLAPVSEGIYKLERSSSSQKN